jgi:hypothetical protein
MQELIETKRIKHVRQMITPIAERMWGVGNIRGRATRSQAEKRQRERWHSAMGVVTQVCRVAGQREVPYLDVEDLAQARRDLRVSIENLRMLLEKVGAFWQAAAGPGGGR